MAHLVVTLAMVVHRSITETVPVNKNIEELFNGGLGPHNVLKNSSLASVGVLGSQKGTPLPGEALAYDIYLWKGWAKGRR